MKRKLSGGNFTEPPHVKVERQIADLELHLEYLDSMYRARHEDLLLMQSKFTNSPSVHRNIASPSSTVSSSIIFILSNMTGMRAVAGLDSDKLKPIRMPFAYHLMPHLLKDPNSLRPIYHLKGTRSLVNVVIGVPTVKRDKESYLMVTLTHLINGMTEEDILTTLIVILVGETDLEFILNTARQIESQFPKEVESGMIEIMSPSESYYPDFDTLVPTLGDSMKRMKWRTKQNLDAAYLMSYAQSKGTFYLMLEDDVIAKKNYLEEIRRFITSASIVKPNWIILEFCRIGGIGKLFRSAKLLHFITYVQLFYNNLPIDWLIESYLADNVCALEKTSRQCMKRKLLVKLRYKGSLFQHIGIYSSLQGKIQKMKDAQFGTVPSFYPHSNPPAKIIHTDIKEHSGHTVRKAYEGYSYFWGEKPKKGNLVGIWFMKPVLLKKFLFRSSNAEHVSDKFYDTVVEVLSVNKSAKFIKVGAFDEFGLAEGTLEKNIGLLAAIRLRVEQDSDFWVILSEIVLNPYDLS